MDVPLSIKLLYDEFCTLRLSIPGTLATARLSSIVDYRKAYDRLKSRYEGLKSRIVEVCTGDEYCASILEDLDEPFERLVPRRIRGHGSINRLD